MQLLMINPKIHRHQQHYKPKLAPLLLIPTQAPRHQQHRRCSNKLHNLLQLLLQLGRIARSEFHHRRIPDALQLRQVLVVVSFQLHQVVGGKLKQR